MVNKQKYETVADKIVCPKCNRNLQFFNTSAICAGCKNSYPFRDGILSFFSEKNVDWHDDYQKKAKNETEPGKVVGYYCKRNYNIVSQNVKKILKDVTRSFILDVGCGHGMTSQWLTQKNTVIGVDFVPEMLEMATKNHLIPIHADGRILPFKENIFDLILSVETIQLIQDAPGFLRYLTRFVKMNGMILITGLNAHSILRRTYHKIKGVLDPHYINQRIPILWDPLQLAGMLKARSFNVEIHYTCFPAKKIIAETKGIHKKRGLGSNFFILAKKESQNCQIS